MKVVAFNGSPRGDGNTFRLIQHVFAALNQEGIETELKALIDRAGFVAGANDNFLRRKVGAAAIAVRRGGAIHAFDSINHFFLIRQMIVPGSCYWNMGIGREKGEVENDEEGVRTMTVLGENMAWLLKKLA